MAPTSAAAWNVAANSQLFDRKIATRSPGLTPRTTRFRASPSTSSPYSAYETRRTGVVEVSTIAVFLANCLHDSRMASCRNTPAGSAYNSVRSIRGLEVGVATKPAHQFACSLLRLQLTQEITLVHVVLECFPPIDKYHRHFVVVAVAQFGIGIDINFLPRELSLGLQPGKALLDNVAQMTRPAGVNHNFVRHSEK